MIKMETNVRLLKALGQKTRYLIIKNLLKGEKCACEIPTLINKTQSNTSMQLLNLVENGILKYRRDGKKILYSIKEKKVFTIFKVIERK
jgi:ArsR family transcriptional regulator, lead/cadmium/zinc/bismuth-responsive transcriptional repressor